MKRSIKALPPGKGHDGAINQTGYIKRTYPRPVRTLPYGCLDFETYTLDNGIQRAYYLRIYHPSIGYTDIRRCDYRSEEDYNRAITRYFERYPSIYFSFNGKKFDHILLNRILSLSGKKPRIWRMGSWVRKIIWCSNVFLDILFWLNPCSLSDMAKTWLNEDLKGLFPYDAVDENIVRDKDGRFGDITIEDFPKKDRDRIDIGMIEKFNGKPFWPLIEEYIKKDIDILVRSLKNIEKEYNLLGYSITDGKYHGMASISPDQSFRYLKGDEFKLFTRELDDSWKGCYMGGICEVNDINLEQRRVNVYDFNGLYPSVMLKYDYPIGEPREVIDPDIKEIDKFFGLIEGIVYNNGYIPLGIPCRIGKEFNRLKGSVLYRGTTEELKN